MGFCQAEVKIYNPVEKKLDPKTNRCFFIVYPAHFKGYMFYCPTRGTKFVVEIVAKFLENDIGSCVCPHERDVILEEEPLISSPFVQEKIMFQGNEGIYREHMQRQETELIALPNQGVQVD